jgi:hypothetical protein
MTKKLDLLAVSIYTRAKLIREGIAFLLYSYARNMIDSRE